MFLVDDNGLGPEDGGEVEQGEDADGVPHDAAAPVVPQLQVVAPQRLVVLLHLRHTCRQRFKRRLSEGSKRFHNNGEGPKYGLLLVESNY